MFSRARSVIRGVLNCILLHHVGFYLPVLASPGLTIVTSSVWAFDHHTLTVEWLHHELDYLFSAKLKPSFNHAGHYSQKC